METNIAILRGINVSGHKLIKMQDLKNLLVELNFSNVNTYIQSGNVVFQCKKTDTKKLSKQIEEAVQKKYEFEVPVITRTIAEFITAANANPFLKQNNIELEKLHLTFLSDIPDKAIAAKIADLDYYPDKFYIVNREIYLYCPNGYGNTKLNNNFFEKKLETSATTRNLKTITELITIA